MELNDFEFDVRVTNCFNRVAIKTLEQLLDKTEEDLLKIRAFGRKSLNIVIESLSEAGLKLKQSPRQPPKPPLQERVDKLARTKSKKYLINLLLNTLTWREAFVVYSRTYLNKTLKETGDCLGVNRERIRQIEAMGLRKLRHPSRSKYLLKFHNRSDVLINKVFEIKT